MENAAFGGQIGSSSQNQTKVGANATGGQICSSSQEQEKMKNNAFEGPNGSSSREMHEKAFSAISYDAACETFMHQGVDKLIQVTEERIRQNKQLFDAILALPPYTDRADAAGLVWQEGKRLLQLFGGFRNFKRVNEEGRMAKENALPSFGEGQ